MCEIHELDNHGPVRTVQYRRERTDPLVNLLRRGEMGDRIADRIDEIEGRLRMSLRRPEVAHGENLAFSRVVCLLRVVRLPRGVGVEAVSPVLEVRFRCATAHQFDSPGDHLR